MRCIACLNSKDFLILTSEKEILSSNELFYFTQVKPQFLWETLTLPSIFLHLFLVKSPFSETIPPPPLKIGGRVEGGGVGVQTIYT